MSLPSVRSLEQESDEEAALFNLDTEDLVAEIMDGHLHLLDQQDDVEQLDPYNAAIPRSPHRAPVTHTGPSAAKPVTHAPSAQYGQYADFPSPLTSTQPPVSPHVKSSLTHHPSGHHKHSRQNVAPDQDVQQTSSHQSRQQHGSRRSSALYDHALSRQGPDEGAHKHHDELSHKLSDLSLYDRHQIAGGSSRRHMSSFVETDTQVRRAEPARVPSSCRHGLPQHADFSDVSFVPRRAHQPEFAVADELDADPDQTSSCEWEDEEDEHEYEEVTVNRNKTAPNGNEPHISTNQDLKHTSLVLAESSAKIMYLCGRKMYEVMWTSQTSQRLRKSAMHTTRNASGSAARSLGRLVVATCEGSLGSVEHYVSRRCSVLKAVRRSPRDIVRQSVARALRMSRKKLAQKGLPMLGLPKEEPEPDIEDNYDFCSDKEDNQSTDASLLVPTDYDDDGLELLNLYEDDMYGDEL